MNRLNCVQVCRTSFEINYTRNTPWYITTREVTCGNHRKEVWQWVALTKMKSARVVNSVNVSCILYTQSHEVLKLQREGLEL